MKTANIGGVVLSAVRPRIAASFWRVETEENLTALRAAGLDIAEVRLDLAECADVSAAVGLCKSFSALPSLPTLLTIRAAAEGGGWRGTEEERLQWFLAALPFCSAVDVELLSPLLPAVGEAARAGQKTLIVSRHNFAAEENLAALEKHREDAFAAGADVFKTASLCVSEGGYETLAAFAFSCKSFPPCVVIGMDDGTDSIFARRARVELPGLGSCLAFAAVARQSAPGQLSLEETVAAINSFQFSADR